jgi:hypothetical protein
MGLAPDFVPEREVSRKVMNSKMSSEEKGSGKAWA